MELIFAIDLRKGLVVKAYAGFRLNYKPLTINSINYSDPIRLLRTILKHIDLNTIYIADLDAIQNLGSNSKLIVNILKAFPNLKFLIDSGFDYPSSVNNFCFFLKKKNLSNYEIILGTEKLKNYNLRVFFMKHVCRISIDFNGFEKKWIRKIKKEKIKSKLIFMFLKNIGGRGVSVKEIKAILNNFPLNKCSVAGGISSVSDIKTLDRIGLDSVVVSTIIHQKYLGTQ